MLRIETPGELGEAIRAARKQLGLTQAKLAERAGCGARFVVELEAGKPTVRLEQVLKVLGALDSGLHLQTPAKFEAASATDAAHQTADAPGLMAYEELLALAQAFRAETQPAADRPQSREEAPLNP